MHKVLFETLLESTSKTIWGVVNYKQLFECPHCGETRVSKQELVVSDTTLSQTNDNDCLYKIESRYCYNCGYSERKVKNK